MRKKIFSVLLCFIIMLMIMPTTADADTGPKPSVVIDFEGLENEHYYVTLLSEEPSTGPHSAIDEDADNQSYYEKDEEYKIWKKFVSYVDKGGFYFLQYFEDCTNTSQFIWGYYPPSKFKILLYFPEQDKFVASEEVYERYAFDSYYKVDANDLEIHSVTIGEGIKAERNYVYTGELSSFFARIILTIAIEVLIALFFGFKTKKQFLLIGIVNIVTQLILNILLNVINYNQDSTMFIFNYVWMEALVFVIEAVIYTAFLNKYGSKESMKKWHALLYALTANAASFGVGLCLAQLIPGIF